MHRLRIILIACLLVTCSVHAGIIGWSGKLTGTSITNGASVSVEDDKYTYMVANPTTWKNEFFNYAWKNRISLRYVDTAVSTGYLAGNWTVSVPCSLQRWDHAGILIGATSFTLSLNINPGQSAQSQDLDVYEINDTSVAGFKTKLWVGTPTFTGTASSVPVDVMLESEIETERYYHFDQVNHVPTISHTTNSTDNTITFYWPHKDGAEEYELEWLHASVYGDGGGTNLSLLNYNKAERISTGSLYYTIQNVFDSGYVYYRLRWVGRDSISGELRKVESKWSTVSSSTRILVNDFDRNRHWSYSESFTENGKRGESLAFMDDLGRGRQMMGLVKTENKLLITEPFFDYEGRAVLQAMAAPDSAYTGKFGFISGFTKSDSTGTALHPKLYDTDDLYSSCSPRKDIKLSTVQGASRYYSSANSLKSYGMNAYLPDAQKYPYVHVRFNNEGDIASMSTPGTDHSLGSGKETQVFFTSVPQEKLFELFGNSVGYADHYRAKYMSDANGQVSGSYEDMSGKVIATFLAGDVPSNVDTISDYPASFDTLLIDLLQYDHFVEANNAFELYNDIMITDAGEQRTFTYGVTPSVYEGLCDTINCHYKLVLEISETNCPVPALYTYTANISATTLTHTTSVTFPRIGKYKVKKTLTLDQDSLVAALQTFINAYDTCNPFIAPPDTVDYGCNDTCPDGEDCNPFSPANTTECQDLYDQMYADMSPGGQYLSSYLRFTELMTAAGIDYDDIEDYHNNNNCGGFANLWDLDDVVNNWTDCLGAYLVTLHPEYCHYGWCLYEDDTCSNGESSRMFDARISTYDTYSEANTAFALTTNAGNEGQQVLDADPYFNCSGKSSLKTTMQNAVNPTADANKMWERAVTIANCGTSPCDNEWGAFRAFYLHAKDSIIAAAKNAAGCNYLTDVASGDPLTGNGINEDNTGNFTIWVPDPTVLDTITVQPSYAPNPCAEKQCTTLTLCASDYIVGDTLRLNVAYTGSGGTNYSYYIIDTTGFAGTKNASQTGAGLAALINLYNPPNSLIGVYPTFSATFTSGASPQLTICISGPNDLDSGNVTFTLYGVTRANPSCSTTTFFPLTFVYDTPDTSGCNPPPPHCFCSELQTFVDAWDATYVDPLSGDTLDIVDHADYTNMLDYITTELNTTHATSVSESDVQTWLDNCDSLGYPVADTVNDPPLGDTLDCTIPTDRCQQEGYAITYQNAYDAWLEEKEEHIQNFIKDYTAACFDSSIFRQRFDMKMLSKEYHFTLYYYDQADNLIRTVSPKAVQRIALDTSNGGNLDDMKAWLAGTSATPYYPSHLYYYTAGTLPNAQTAVPDIHLVTAYKYNTLNQPTQTTHADQTDTSKFYYDHLSRLVASQNPKQAAYSPPRYSYTLFDSLGRITEVGELVTDSVLTQSISSVDTLWEDFLSYASAHYEVTQSFYDKNAPIVYNTNGFDPDTNFTRNRVATITYERIKDAYDTTYDAASYYQYDVHGNAECVLKDVTELTSLSQNLKQTRYEYELISGNVNKVVYQEGEPDQFIHTYDYDDDDRLVREYTSHQGIIYHNDQKQFYYLHGPMGRTETGQHKVQGTDYMYTIQGWMKGVNGATLNQHTEAGKDGKQDSLLSGYCSVPQYINGTSNKNLHSRIASDAFGYILNYYDSNTGGAHTAAEDYKPINTNSYSVLADINSQNISSRNLYNGNIKQMSVALMRPNANGTGVDPVSSLPRASQALELLTWQYKYDQLQRLTEAIAFTGTSTATYASLANSNEYKNTFTYDANGNILTQIRNGNSTQVNLDQLTYSYATATNGGSTNRLASISEGLGSTHNGNYSDDFDLVSRPTSCTYDEIGNLKVDQRHFITEIKWNVYGKVTEVIKDKDVKFDDWDNDDVQDAGEPSLSLSDIEYRYNEMGQRIVKIVKPHHATNSDIKDQDDWSYTYYSYDAGGNVIGVYERDYTKPAGVPQKYNDVLKLEEHHIYGSERVGMATYSNKEVAKITYDYSSTTNHIFSGTNAVASNYALNDSTEKRTLGTRLYELANHLGNVLVSITDKKIPVFENFTNCASQSITNTFTHYTADVQSSTDYSPFGAPLAGRTFSTNIYRYGMNGQEKENEIYGDGNAMSAEYWMYDARLGRRWNRDPIVKPWESVYVAFANNPIYFNDVYGLNAAASSTVTTGGGNEGDEFTPSDPNAGCEPDPKPVTPPITPGTPGGDPTPSVPEVAIINDNPKYRKYYDYVNNKQWTFHFVFESITPTIYQNTVTHLAQRPDYIDLTYNGGGAARDANRKQACPPGSCPGQSCDEFPYACTQEGGAGAFKDCVPPLENSTQGGFMLWTTTGLNAGDEIIVVPVSKDGTIQQPAARKVPQDVMDAWQIKEAPMQPVSTPEVQPNPLPIPTKPKGLPPKTENDKPIFKKWPVPAPAAPIFLIPNLDWLLEMMKNSMGTPGNEYDPSKMG